MTGATKAAAPPGRGEFTIYTFDRADAPECQSPWQKHGSLHEKGKAIRIAHNLFNSGRYGRIEVKGRYFDRSQKRVVDVTLKTFGGVSRPRLGASSVWLVPALCGIIALIAFWKFG